MKKYMKCIALALSAALLLGGCGATAAVGTSTDAGGISVIAAALDVNNMFSGRDLDPSYEESSAAHITLTGDSAESDSKNVAIDGSTVTITDEGVYILTGTLTDGMIIVEAENTDKVQLVLRGASISSATSAAVYVKQADKVFLTADESTQNTLAGGESFVAIDENNIDAAVFSKDDLTINGSGSLTITSPAGHGVVSKDDLVLAVGILTITAASHGLCGKESIRVASGDYVITAGKDGLHAEDADDTALGYLYIADGTFTIQSDGDGISTSNTMQVDNGVYHITAGGGSATVSQNSSGDWSWDFQGGFGRGHDDAAATETTGTAAEENTSAKGMKASVLLQLNGGSVTIDSADDALHANGDLSINGGTYTLSTGDDGLHADGSTTIAGGTIDILTSYEGIEGLTIDITGGDITLVSADDGLNAAGGTDSSGAGGYGGFQGGGFDADGSSYIHISGGTLHINADGDGVDSNGALTVSGGETYVSGPTNSGNGALDYGSSATISGGVFVAAGASGMAQNFGAESTQGVMLVSLAGSEGALVTLTDSTGKTLLTWTAEKSFQCVVISCPDIADGGSYTVSADGNTVDVSMSGLVYGEGTGGFMGGKGGGSFTRPDRGQMTTDGGMHAMPDGEVPDDIPADGSLTRPAEAQTPSGV